MQPNVEELHQLLTRTLRDGTEQNLKQQLAEVNPADVAEVMELLEDVDRSRTLFALDSRTAAETIVLLDERVRDEVVDDLPEDQFAEIITALPADDAADVLGELPSEESDKLLEKLPDEQSEEIEKLLEHDESTAGGLMNPRVISVPQLFTVKEGIRHLREIEVSDDEVFFIYSTDHENRLSGVVPARRLLLTSSGTLLSDIMEPDPISVTVDEDQESVLQLFRKYDLTSLPVVDDYGKLVGHITVDDIMDVAAEEADEDMYHMAGTDAAERATSSIFRASGIRFVWLLPAFMFMTGTVVVLLFAESKFQGSLWGALVAFVPMIGALAGACGVQSATVVIRGFATGELAPSKFLLVLEREGRIAIVMAPACALIAACLTYLGLPFLQDVGAIHADSGVTLLRFSMAVGVGMLAGILLASMLGILTPFVFRKLAIDPAIAAGPVVTTANDVMCVSTYLVLSHLIVTRW